ncbi:phosphate signaling complex protein PhoU [Mycoplasma putrefaciens]|uniref:Phosphate transport system regulator PhoU n=2 Tax=Mycoplasma putrefaciens TaxID=2123 RepID=M9WHQ5_9MOLU|nr:phosphate signaling complex protein PhoU [Mycoplasma putrefaciens]AEM68633.1 phosphate transport system regulatory protein PhoU [Mycoplasma putrefaciens KS1]AGJ90904.1 Phosphate transport system regulator PhoU [Mycoplasma putrefaciens Mput9231]
MAINKILDNDLEQLQNMIEEMIETTKIQYAKSFSIIRDQNPELAELIIEHDKIINAMQNQFTSAALWKISKQKLIAKDLRLAIGGILISREIERVADYSKSISRFFSSYHPNQQQVDMIVELFELVVEMLDAFSHLFSNPEINTNKITDLEVKISNKFKEFYAILIEYLKQAKTTKEVEKIIAVMKQIINLERAGDHLINVQEIVTFIKTGKFIELKEYN